MMHPHLRKPMALPTSCTTEQKIMSLVIGFLCGAIVCACIIIFYLIG